MGATVSVDMLNPPLPDEAESPRTEAGNFWLRVEEAASLRVNDMVENGPIKIIF